MAISQTQRNEFSEVTAELSTICIANANAVMHLHMLMLMQAVSAAASNAFALDKAVTALTLLHD